MSRIIVIAEGDYQIFFENLTPVRAIPGGTLLNVAIELNKLGCHEIVPVSEVGNDFVGALMIDEIKKNGLPAESVDCSADIQTPATLVFLSPDGRHTVRYTHAFDGSTDGLDVVWPRIEATDTILFGGYMAVNPRVHKNLWQLLEYARERGSKIVYFPGFDPGRVSSITKVMPMILENIEISNTVVCRDEDLKFIFQNSDSRKVYADRLAFYGVDLMSLAPDNLSAVLFTKKAVTQFALDASGSAHHAIAQALEAAVVNK